MLITDTASLAAWARLANTDPEFLVVSRWTDVDVTILLGEMPGGSATSFRITEGAFGIVTSARLDRLVEVKASRECWAAFENPTPPRHSHHILAMDRRRPDFCVERGRALLIQNLRVIDVALQLLRSVPVEGDRGEGELA